MESFLTRAEGTASAGVGPLSHVNVEAPSGAEEVADEGHRERLRPGSEFQQLWSEDNGWRASRDLMHAVPMPRDA